MPGLDEAPYIVIQYRAEVVSGKVIMRLAGIELALWCDLILGGCVVPGTLPQHDEAELLISVRPAVDGTDFFKGVAVHDPFIVRADDGSFYWVGSCLAVDTLFGR